MTGKLLEQAKQVVAGTRVIPDHIVSFFDPEARPIKKGKLAKVTEFGYKVRIDETESGFVTGYAVYQGNPSDRKGKKSQKRTEEEQQLWVQKLAAIPCSRRGEDQPIEAKVRFGPQQVSGPCRLKKLGWIWNFGP